MTHLSLRVRRALIATVTALATATAVVPAVNATDLPFENIGNFNDAGSETYSKDTPALAWNVFKLSPVAYDVTTLSHGSGGARIDGKKAFFPFVEKQKDGSTLTLRYTGSVSLQAWCRDAASDPVVAAHGNCGDDVTVTDPYIVINDAKKLGELHATVYSYSRSLKKFNGPKEILVGTFDVEKAKKGSFTKDHVTTINGGERNNRIDGVSLKTYSREIISMHARFTKGAKGIDNFQLSYRDENAENTGTGGKPVLLGEYKKNQTEPFKFSQDVWEATPGNETTATAAEAPTGASFAAAENNPKGASVDPATGAVTYTPEAKMAGKLVAVGVDVTYEDGSKSLVPVYFQVGGQAPSYTSYSKGQYCMDYMPGWSNLRLVADEGKPQFSTTMRNVIRGIAVGNQTNGTLTEANSSGFTGGFYFKGINRSGLAELDASRSVTFYVSDDDAKIMQSGSRTPVEFKNYTPAKIKGLVLTPEHTALKVVTRNDNGTGALHTIAPYSGLNSGESTDITTSWDKQFDFPPAEKIFGPDMGAGETNLWGLKDDNGIPADLLLLDDGTIVWVNDVPSADPTKNFSPVHIKTTEEKTSGTVTAPEVFKDVFAGTRDAEHAIHAASQGNRIVFFNQSGYDSEKPEVGDTQLVAVYDYHPDNGTFTKVTKIPGPVAGVANIVAATFDEKGNPVFVDNRGVLAAVNPTTLEVIQSAKVFEGMERLASMNRRILVRKGPNYYTLGEGKQGMGECTVPHKKFGSGISKTQAQDGNARIQYATPTQEELTLTEETTNAADLYTPAYTTTGDNQKATPANPVTADVSYTTGTDTKVTGRVYAEYALKNKEDSRFEIDSKTGQITYRATAEDQKAKDAVTAVVTITYSDRTSEEAEARFTKFGTLADNQEVVGTVTPFDPGAVKPGKKVNVQPQYSGLVDGKSVALPEDITYSLGKTGDAAKFTVNKNDGSVTFTPTAEDIASGVVRIPITVSFADESTKTFTVEVKIPQKQIQKPGNSSQQKPGTSSSNKNTKIGLGVAGVILVLILGALMRFVGPMLVQAGILR